MELHLPCGIRQLPATTLRWMQPAVTPTRQASTRFTYHRGMEGWVDLGVSYIPFFVCRQSVTRPTSNHLIVTWHWVKPMTLHLALYCYAAMPPFLYKGRSINKIAKWHDSINSQNRKNPKYTFCKEFNSEYHMWVLLGWCYCVVIYKHWIRWCCHWNCLITNSVILCLFCGQKLNAHYIHLKMHPVFGNKCFYAMQIVHVWCKTI